jgi:hypothetical protein
MANVRQVVAYYKFNQHEIHLKWEKNNRLQPTWRRLLQKHVVRITFDIYVFIT